MMPRILLVNPPIYDFSAYDFWMRPYGLLTVGGYLRGRAELRLFDFLDRLYHAAPDVAKLRADERGRGAFHAGEAPKPEAFSDIPRRYRRYGLPRGDFLNLLTLERPFDFALVGSGMTYWYPGVKEVIEDIRRLSPPTKIVLGGIYATICPDHARSLGPDLVIEGSDLERLWRFLGISPSLDETPFWEAYGNLQTGVIKLTDGCPFRCTYCSAPSFQPRFAPRPLGRALGELSALSGLNVRNVAFYDDALLYDAEHVLLPFLDEAHRRAPGVSFHTPNAVHAMFMTADVAEHMVMRGVRSFYAGFESNSQEWHERTGGKIRSDEMTGCVRHLVRAGVDPREITAYVMLGHPLGPAQSVEEAMLAAHRLGVRIMLAEFSPIPGTPDGDLCGKRVDMSEPLNHNKTAFPIRLMGNAEVQRLKDVCRELNQSLF